MAVPIVTLIDPASGPSMGGNMIEIQGMNFSLPVPSPPAGPGPTPIVASVEVTLGGAPAQVSVVSDTRMFVQAPKYSLIAANGAPIVSQPVDVVITNLDTAGAPIPGETITVADGYTYGRIDISSENESDLSRLTRTYIRLIKSEVVSHVTHETHTDYEDLVTGIAQAEATLPGVSIIGPTLVQNRLQRPATNPSDIPLGQANEYLTARYIDAEDLYFDFIGYSDNQGEFLNLLALAREFVDRNVFISMLCDPSAPDAGYISYEMEYVPGGRFSVEAQTGGTQNSNLRVFRGQIKIVGFAASGLSGVKRDRALAVSADVGEGGPELRVTSFPGDTTYADPVQSRRSPPPGGN
jgi:hypothetical protein